MYDPHCRSCTKFIATVAREKYGYEAPDLDELVKWADIIDGAQYPDAKTAVELGAPAMKLTLVIEGAKGSDIVEKVIRWMRRSRLAEIMAQPEIQELYAPLYERHLKSIDIIRSRAVQADGVVFFDLVGHDLEGYNKFIPYYLFPRVDLHGLGEQVQFPHEGLRRLQSLGARAARRTTWPPSASAMAAAATPGSAPSVSTWTPSSRRARPPREIVEELKK